MPLTKEQKDAVAQLKEVPSADGEEFASELKSNNGGLYQFIFRGGFKQAEERYKEKAKEAEAARDEAVEAKEKAENDLKEVQNKTPDVEKLNSQWQEKLDKEKEKAEAKLKEQVEINRAEREKRKLSDLRAELTGLDPVFIDSAAPANKDRLRYDDKGELHLYEEGSDVPIQLGKEETPVKKLASEIREKADARWHLSNSDRGGGTRGGAGGTELSEKAIEDRARKSGTYAPL